MKEMFKVGDKVYHITKGWTEIKSISDSWVETIDSNGIYDLYGNISIFDKNPTIYPYNPFDARVVEVSSDGKRWYNRVFIKMVDEYAICWGGAETIKDSKNSTYTNRWQFIKEIQPQKKLTSEEKINILWDNYSK